MRNLILYAIAIHFLFMGCIDKNHNSRTNHYYINSQSGNDANNRISINSPWKSLKKLEEITFQPGDSILFAKNSVVQGGITFKSSGNAENPIVVSNYGEGAIPSFSNLDQNELNGNVFQISGSHIVIDGLSFSKCADANSKNGKSILEVGAIFTQTDADHITVKNCEFIDCPIGVNITGQHSLIIGNTFKDCNRFLAAPSWGPLGIVIGNAYNEISHNTCSNYVNIGGNYGADGGFIELDDRYFGTKVHDIKIHHNKSFDNMGFLEIETNVEGNNIDVYYNLSDDYQQFIFYWGGDSSKIENNTVIRTKPSLNGAVNTVFTMRKGNFTLRNNIFVVANRVQVLVTAPYDVGNYNQVIHKNNLYFCTDGSTNDPCGKPLGAGEIIANPHFVDINSGDYQLRSKSPAINSGMVLGYGSDLDNVPFGENQISDMGAYEKKD
ncbi:hypothetical protein HQ585_12165 [candidate division KSB1 bacterium]|nr:hypothetical protein [candidate division KSB1 bacterium]